MAYNHEKIEKKWQRTWEKEKIYHAKDFSKKPKFYGLIEFPYLSGEGLHIGHIRSNTAMDIICRKRRMSGFNVLYPIGWDAFGLPTENYAIKTGINPKIIVKKNVVNFRRQLKPLGFSFDWTREINTTDPKYYKWTQWIFLQLYKHGLAYKKKMPINWCPSCKIGLANEEVINGRCERCGTPVVKKEKEQWLLRITKYADKLLKDLKNVDYLEKIKIQQENWIGRSEGAEIEFKIKNKKSKINVFTTRPDTLFGATYLVLSPEHELLRNNELKIRNYEEVKKYIERAKRKTELQRTNLAREKTGVELRGLKAINPVNKKEIPIWVADYVLATYGTGAIMAVPAHDERDFDFAKKFKLPIIQVVAQETGIKRPNEEKRDGGFAFVFDTAKQKYAVGKDTIDGRIRLFSGGIDEGENEIQGIKREVREEGGLYDFAHVEKIGTTFAHYHNKLRHVDRVAEAHGFLIILKSDKIKPVKLEEHEKFELAWVTPEEMEKNWQDHNQEGNYTHWINFLQSAVARAIELEFDKKNDSKKYKPLVYIGDGILVNSGKFDGLDSEKAKQGITKFVGGKKKIQYHLRDWIFSRQHYWGEPIPIIFCKKCGEVPVPKKDLPVKLPDVKKYQPTDTGESPLASITKWINVKCPKCGGPAKRETDTMPNWAGSSWYFLRYIDPQNGKALADFKKLKYWMPVDWYNGGMEHTTLHLLYSRFWNKFLYDIGAVPTSEPYQKRTSHGLILGQGGEKMSKSKGNVVNPNNMVKNFGADAFRLYEMFMGPFDQAIPWDPKGIIGCSRFLQKVWEISENRNISDKIVNHNLEKLLHQTIKKISEDVELMNFNTAVSSLMIFINDCYVLKEIPQKTWEIFLKLLAPFTPFVTEELWEKLGHKISIHLEFWPEYDPKLIKEESFELIIQINGKMRDKISAQTGISQKEAEKLALSQEKVKIWLKNKRTKKVIFVPNRLINFVL